MKTQKPSGTLKRFVDAGKTDTAILGAVERYVIAKPADEDRRTDVLHPSEIAKSDWCHRAAYFELLGHKPGPSKYKKSLTQALVFSEGHRIHRQWQSWLGEMGRLYGVWQCDSCFYQEWGMGHAPCQEKRFGGCTGHLTKYLEVPLEYPKLRISGKADGWIPEPKPRLLEIKSVGAGTVRFENPSLFYEHKGDAAAMFKSIKAPFHSHITQTQIYAKLLELINVDRPWSLPVPEEIIFIYEFKATQEVKEFIVAKSDFGITEIFDGVMLVNAAVDKGVPPYCNIGGKEGCYKCLHHQEENSDEASS